MLYLTGMRLAWGRRGMRQVKKSIEEQLGKKHTCFAHIYINVCTYTCVCLRMDRSVYRSTNVSIGLSIHLSLYIYVCVYTYVYTYMYIYFFCMLYIYIHTQGLGQKARGSVRRRCDVENVGKCNYIYIEREKYRTIYKQSGK